MRPGALRGPEHPLQPSREQRERNCRGDQKSRPAAAHQEVQDTDRKHQPNAEVVLDQADRASDVDGRIETQIDFEVGVSERAGVQLDDRFVYFVENSHRIRVIFSLNGDVVSRETVAQCKSVRLARHNVNVGKFTQVDRPVAAPADDKLIELVRLELTDKTYCVLSPANIGKSTRTVG